MGLKQDQVTIWCLECDSDHDMECHCYYQFDDYYEGDNKISYSKEYVIERAKRVGWHISGNNALCPECKKKEVKP